MKKAILLLILSLAAASCNPAAQRQNVNGTENMQRDYFDVIADRLAFHLSTYIEQKQPDRIKDAIFYEMPYPRVYAILAFYPDGKYIDGFIKEEGKIKQLIYTVYFRDPTGMSIKVRKIYNNGKETGVIKVFYR